LGAGILFLIQPDFLFIVLPQPDSTTWITLVGLLLIVLALYYKKIAVLDDINLHKLTNYTRLSVLAAIGVLIALGRLEPIFITFGLADAAFAIASVISLNKIKSSNVGEQ